MNDPEAVEVLHAFEKLPAKAPNHGFWKLEFALLHKFTEVATWYVLHQNEEVLLRLKEVHQLNHILMLTDLEDLKFPMMLGHFCGVHVLLIDGLDCNLLPCDFMRCQSDDTVSARTKLALHFVVIFQASDPSYT